MAILEPVETRENDVLVRGIQRKIEVTAQSLGTSREALKLLNERYGDAVITQLLQSAEVEVKARTVTPRPRIVPSTPLIASVQPPRGGKKEVTVSEPRTATVEYRRRSEEELREICPYALLYLDLLAGDRLVRTNGCISIDLADKELLFMRMQFEVAIGQKIAKATALSEMRRLELRPAIFEELLSYIVRYPEVQKTCKLIALGSEVLSKSTREVGQVPCAHSSDGVSMLSVWPLAKPFEPSANFLVVGKKAGPLKVLSELTKPAP